MLKLSVRNPVWILSNPRVGSTYLQTLLNNAKSDSLPVFSPWFNEYYLNPTRWEKRLPYNNKIHTSHFERYVSHIDLEELLPGIKYVRIRRRDYSAVAVSHYLAISLSQFIVIPHKDIMDKSEVEYDEEKIMSLYKLAKEWDDMWDAYLDTRESLDLYYMDLVEDPEGTVEKVIRYSGFEKPYQLNFSSSHVTVKMEHPQKEDLLNRFRRVL